MGTFHADTDALHGFTVCVETTGPLTYIGRWHEEQGGRVLLLGVVAHRDGEEGLTSAQFIRKAALEGFHATAAQALVAREEIRAVRKLGDLASQFMRE